MIYNEPVENKGFLWQRRLELQLTYNYGIGINLSQIQVEEVAPNVVTLKIPKSEVKLAYVELDANNSVVNETKTMLVRSFTAEETRFILGYSQDSVTNKVKADKDIYNKSVESLKVNLEQLVTKLGFKRVIVEEV
jgi:putative lipase involved disintegration of autophagic bodies